MTEENKEFETWEDVIVDFLERKKESEEENYLKEQIKIISKAFEQLHFFNEQDIKNLFDSKKNKKGEHQSSLDFQREKLETIFSFEQQPEELDIDKIKEDFQEKCEKLAKKFSPYKWIAEAAQNAASISFATHVIKLTHSKIDSPSFYDQINAQKPNVLSTSSIKEKIIDGAVSGNQFAPIYQFLELELNGKKLATTFADTDNQVLKPFVQSDEELANWNKGFSKSLITDLLSSHSLAKQVYFPYDIKQKQYHLLCHVKSSSLAHALFEKITDDSQKEVKKLREKNKFSNHASDSFPQKAVINVTASNHSNASQLNGKRGGRLYLFSCQPPTWETQLKPPINYQSFFYAVFLQPNTRVTINYLRDFLLRYQGRDLSIKDPESRKWINLWVSKIVDDSFLDRKIDIPIAEISGIIDDIFSYVADIQNLPSGWSNTEKIKLKPAHQYFLDPYRDDEAFQTARNNSDWQTVICHDFAHWLNHKLIGKDKKFAPQQTHTRIWRELFEQPLREYNDMIEINARFKEEA